MWPIARLTFREMLHKRVFYLVLVMTAAFLVLYAFGLNYSYKDMGIEGGITAEWWLINGMLVAEMFGAGMYFSSFIYALLAIMSSIGSIGPEIENGIIYGILAKPITRREVVMGKFLGYALMLGVYGLLFFLAVFGINYFYVPQGVLMVSLPYFLAAAGLYIFQGIILLCFGLFLSARFDILNAGIVAVILYGIGLVGGFLEQLGASIHSSGLTNVGVVTSLLMPVDAVYRKMLSMFLIHNQLPIALVGPGVFGVSSIPSTVMVCYGLIYAAVFFLLGVRFFEHRDL